MKPRCAKHNRAMRWLPWKRFWVCPLPLCPERSAAAGPAKGKPIRRTQGCRIFADGRVVLRGWLWRVRKLEVYEMDGRCCVQCGLRLDPPGSGAFHEAEIHHIGGRGMHGSKRDDRIFVEGKRNLETRCAYCHRAVKRDFEIKDAK